MRRAIDAQPADVVNGRSSVRRRHAAMNPRERASAASEAAQSSDIRSQELVPVAERVAAELPFDEATRAAMAHAVHGFLESVSARPNPASIAFVDRRDSYVRPSLDVYVLWSHPLQRVDLQEMDELTAEHRKLLGELETVSPSFNSHLDIVDPRRYRSPEAFTAELTATFNAASARVVACHRLAR